VTAFDFISIVSSGDLSLSLFDIDISSGILGIAFIVYTLRSDSFGVLVELFSTL